MVFDVAISRLERARERIEKYVDQHIVQWTEEEGLEIVRNIGRSAGLTDYAIEKIHVEKDGFMRAVIRWGLKTKDGKPLDLFLEEGTDEHDIEVRFAKFLVFEIDGQIFKKKKVHHPGTTALNIFKNGKKPVNAVMKRKITREINNYLSGDRNDR